jgi:PAS domain S-box-containing protein
MIKNIIRTLKIKISPELRDEFNREVTFQNIQNGIIFSLLTIGYTLISMLYVFRIYRAEIWESVPEYKYISLFNIAIILFFLLIAKIFSQKSPAGIKQAHKLMVFIFALLFLIWCSFSSLAWQKAGFPIQIYTLGILFATAGLILTNRESLILYISTLIFYEAASSIFIQKSYSLSSDNNFLIVSILFVISRSIYYYRMKEFLTAKTAGKNLYAAIEIIEDGLIIIGLDGKIIDANHSAVALYESDSKETLTGKNILEIIADEDASGFTQNLASALETGRIKGNLCTVKTSKGKFFPAELNFSVINDEEKKPSAVVILIKNIIEENKLQLEQNKRESYMRTLVNRIPEYIFIYQDNKIVYVNEYVSDKLGYKYDEVMGRNIFDFIASENDKAIVLKNLARRINGEDVEDYEITINDANGNPRILIVRAQLFNYGDKPAILAFGVDITERKKLQYELNRILSQNTALLATVPVGIAFTVDRKFKWVNL